MALTVFCLGNEYIPSDDLSHKLKDHIRLEGIELISCPDTDSLLTTNQTPLVVIDVVRGITEVMRFSPAELEEKTIRNPHDLDAGFFLKLLHATEGKKIEIIGIPPQPITQATINTVRSILEELRP